jgi:hypothetical protein
MALPRPRLTRLLACHPMLCAVTAALGAGTALCAGLPAALVALAGTAGAADVALRTRWVRARIERSAGRASLRARRERREDLLEDAGVRKQRLAAATQLVDQITAIAPVLAARLDLEPLLDRHVELELAVKRCESAAAARTRARSSRAASAIRARVAERATAVQRTCEARLAVLREELASITDFLQVIVHRCALDATALDGDPLEERMSRFLAEDGAADATDATADDADTAGTEPSSSDPR